MQFVILRILGCENYKAGLAAELLCPLRVKGAILFRLTDGIR